MDKAAVPNPVERDAIRYLEDQAYSVLLDCKETMRSAEIIEAIGNEKYSTKLLRHVLAASPRFAQIDRRWDLEVRYEDKQRPVQRVLGEVIAQYGRPMSVEQIANELASIYERPFDYYESIVPRMLADREVYFSTPDGLFGLSEWLLAVTSDNEEDVIFDNGLDEEEISALDKAAKAKTVNWKLKDIGAVVGSALAAANTGVDNKLIGLFRWRAMGEDFDPVATFDTLLESTKVTLLSDMRWVSARMIKKYDSLLIKTADKLAEEVVEKAPPSVAKKAAAKAKVAPALSLTISERDLDEVAQIMSETGGAGMPAILETIFEISARDAEYPVAAEGLGDAMRADPRFVWLGAERWRMADTIPECVNAVPPELAIPKLELETPEGERLDVELEDQGLETGLAKEIRNPLVQDIGDQEPITEQEKLPATESARCVLTQHHKALGTLPLCQIPRAFFPLGPELVQVTLVEGHKKSDIWANWETGLLYDMGKWYSKEMPDSGTVFELVKTDKPDEFQFVYENKTDPLVFVAPNRIEELSELAKEAKKHELSTFELMAKIMPSHRKGVQFVTLFTEMNLVRRTTRRLVASVLSSYYAFYRRTKSPLWYFDGKKVDQGFKKAKRKYIRKER